MSSTTAFVRLIPIDYRINLTRVIEEKPSRKDVVVALMYRGNIVGRFAGLIGIAVQNGIDVSDLLKDVNNVLKSIFEESYIDVVKETVPEVIISGSTVYLQYSHIPSGQSTADVVVKKEFTVQTNEDLAKFWLSRVKAGGKTALLAWANQVTPELARKIFDLASEGYAEKFKSVPDVVIAHKIGMKSADANRYPDALKEGIENRYEQKIEASLDKYALKVGTIMTNAPIIMVDYIVALAQKNII